MNNVISLSKFLSRYAALKGMDLSKIKHDEVKALFPQLKRATFDEVKSNKELIYSGRILLVSDGKKTIPYYVPVLDMSCTEKMELHREEVKPFKVDNSKHDYTSMSESALRIVLRRKFNSYKNQCSARKELESRGISITKKYKRKQIVWKEDC